MKFRQRTNAIKADAIKVDAIKTDGVDVIQVRTSQVKANRKIQHQWRLMWFRLCLVLGSSVTLSGSVGALWAWQWAEQYVRQELAPQIADELAQSLNRPVILGAIEQISPTGLRLGASQLPATAGDRDQVTIQAIDIGFSLVDLLQGKLGLTVTLIKPHLFIDQAANGDWLNTEIVLQDEDIVEVRRVVIRDATVVAAPFKEAQSKQSTHTLNHVFASVTLPQSQETIPFRLRGTVTTGGTFRTSGTINLADETAKVSVNLQQLALTPLSSLLPSGFDVQSGQLSSRLTAELSSTSPIALHGTAQLTDAAARVPGEPNPFSDTSGKLRFQGQSIWIEQGTTRFGNIPFQVTGLIHLQNGLDLDAQVQSVSVADFMETFNLKLPVPATGALKSNNLKVAGPFEHVVFSATVVDAAPISIDRVTFETIYTEFTLDKQSDRLLLSNTELVPTLGGTVRGAAQIQLGDIEDATINSTMVDIPLDRFLALYEIVTPEEIAPGNLDATTRLQVTETEQSTAIDWQLTQGSYPAQGVIAIEDDKIDFRQTSIHLPGGTVHARGTMIDGNWHAQLNVPELGLSALSSELAGTAQGEVELAGNLRSLSPESIMATGRVILSPDTTPLAEPITTQWRWDGDRLHLREAVTPTLQMQGWADVAFTDQMTPEITQVDLNVQVPNYHLATSPIDLPEGIHLAGQSSLRGRIFGALDHLQLLGQVTVHDLRLNAIAFAPQLTGTIQFNAAQQGRLTLAGGSDQIALQVNLPQEQAEFQVQKKQAHLQGTWHDSKLQAVAQDIPLTLLTSTFRLDPRLQNIQGLLSGTVNADLTDVNNPDAVVNGSITHLALTELPDHLRNRHQRDRLTAQLHYTNGIATLTAGELFWGGSKLYLTGRLQSQPEAELMGAITLEHGELQDIATVMQWVDSQDTVVSLQSFTQPSQQWLPTSINDGLQPSLQQILSQSLKGTLSGQLQFHLAPASELRTSFALQGEHWQWGEYQLEHMSLANGSLNGTALAIDNLQLRGISYNGSAQQWRSPNTTLRLDLDSQRQAAQIQVAQLPLNLLGTVLGSPLPWQGQLEAIAHVDYGAASPQVTGELAVRQPQISELVLRPFQLAFNYHNGQVGIGAGLTHPLVPVARGNPATDGGIATLTSALEFKQLNLEAIASVTEPTMDLSQTVVLTYGLFRPSLTIDNLNTFVQTGEIPSGWDIYFDIANLEPADLRQMMTQTFTINVGLLDDLLNSSLGDAVLEPISQIIHPPSHQSSVAALRSALLLSAQDDHQISLMELLQNYPTSEVHIDLSHLKTVMEQLTESE